MLFEDTIAAIATAPGEGGIGIIRISGNLAEDIAKALFRSQKGLPIPIETHTIKYGFVTDPDSGEKLDEALMIFMAQPRSFTTEPVIELHCHGGAVALGRVLDAVIRQGARVAEPGEFTKRAFLSGRIDLSQAEAALDIIRARTVEAEKLALKQLEGTLSEKINQIREALINICAHVEAHLDFPEEEIEPDANAEILKSINDIETACSALAESFSQGRLYREGLKTAIVGRPNVGKSSLLNLLLERDRAIVTPAPGTTRDIIEESLNIKGLPVVVMDTAGIRESHDMAESEGVRRSLIALDEADIVLAVFDSSQPLHDEDHLVLSKIKGKKAILVFNKSDLPQIASTGDIGDKDSIKVSAKKGVGIEELRDAIYSTALAGSAGGGEAEGIVVTNRRHRESLLKAGGALEQARNRLNERAPLEVCALELRDALDALGEIVGAISTDEILNRIFSSFCIGK
jgi:tRNA modification GTPase